MLNVPASLTARGGHETQFWPMIHKQKLVRWGLQKNCCFPNKKGTHLVSGFFRLCYFLSSLKADVMPGGTAAIL